MEALKKLPFDVVRDLVSWPQNLDAIRMWPVVRRGRFSRTQFAKLMRLRIRGIVSLGLNQILIIPNLKWAGFPLREAMLRAMWNITLILVPYNPPGALDGDLQTIRDSIAQMLDEEGEFILRNIDQEINIPTPPPTPPPTNDDEEADEAGPSTKRPRTH